MFTINSKQSTFLFMKKRDKKIDPINVLIPTKLKGLISDVLIIIGIVPQEIANTVIAA